MIKYLGDKAGAFATDILLIQSQEDAVFFSIALDESIGATVTAQLAILAGLWIKN